MFSCIYSCIMVLFLWRSAVNSMSIISNHKTYFLDNTDPESELSELISAKGYPNENKFPKLSTGPIKKEGDEVSFILSKLSDAELVKLLNQYPKKNEYDLNDLIQVAMDSKATKKLVNDQKVKESNKERVVNDNSDTSKAYFRLDDKKIKNQDPNYEALITLSNVLSDRQVNLDSGDDAEQERKELLFDVLVAQLKTLCCKSHKSKKSQKYKSITNKAPAPVNSVDTSSKMSMVSEQMFLILNDEIRGYAKEDIISVDPDSLNRNSSVLLLGPITSPLTDRQLKTVMDRISNELEKPEYLSLLQQLSVGKLKDENVKLMKSLVTGLDARRYIKPHRCNYQSKLARVYGGPQWVICSGYINLNTPSIYDK